MKDKITFETVLEKHEGMDATGITMPFDVEQIFSAKRVPVKVTINGAEYRSTIMKMNGKFMMAIPKTFRETAKIAAGETIIVEMEKDTEKRTAEIPNDLADELAKSDLSEVFAKLSYTHQKEHVNAIGDAKKAETRNRRIAKTIEMLISKRK